MSLNFSRVAGLLLALTVFLAPATLRAQASIADLPPVDQVFRLSADAAGTDEIQLNWAISKGYYLYRHSLKVTAVSGFENPTLKIPTGKKAHDEFFGDVETYRNALRVGVLGQGTAPTAELTVRYQGCADVGVCYPPQTKTIRVALPVSKTDSVASPTNGYSNPLLGGGGLFGKPAGGVDLALPADQAFALSARAMPDNAIRISLMPVPGYYLYQRQIRVTSGDGNVILGAPKWPKARLYDDPEFGKVPVYFDPVELLIPTTRKTSATAQPLRLSVDFQGCKENGVCYPPMRRDFTVNLPADARGIATATAVAAATAVPVMAPGAASAPEVLATQGILPPTNATALPIATAAKPVAPVTMSAGVALLLALLGGLILNLMPCVLPVLSLKALSLAQHNDHPATARRTALAYTGGVLLSFLGLGALLLALRGAGDSVGWAFQMQQPIVIILLALLMFALGLSLSGVWYAGGKWLGYGQTLTTGNHWKSDFFTGFLAVLVATPCVAPFMGAAMAWAFFAPTPLALAVFLALGLGLALPFLLIGFFPAIARILPRPGAWMETFKQLMAFPMYLAAIWLLWVLGQQRGTMAIAWGLVAALLLAFAVWAWTRANRTESLALKITAILAGLLIALPIYRVVTAPPSAVVSASESHVVFDAAKIESLRGQGQNVFVNLTADWCITCKVNERAVLSTDRFKSALRDTNTVYMVGDYTNVDARITAYLNEFGAVGVPLYVFYPAKGSPIVLPTLLTQDRVLKALQSHE